LTTGGIHKALSQLYLLQVNDSAKFLSSKRNERGELKTMKEQFNTMQTQLQTLIAALGSIKDQNQINQTAQMLYKSGILGEPKAK
jgi:hypothetical protein